MTDWETLAVEDVEQVVWFQNAHSGLRAVMVIHDTTRGPAFGGIRLARYDTPDDAVRDALRLAQAMTHKCALAGIPGGGGKIVMLDHPGLRREPAFETLGWYIESLGGRFRGGRDLGVTAADLEVLHRTTRHVTEEEPGGCGDLNAATAGGVLAGMHAALEAVGESPDLHGRPVAVQGLGGIGNAVASAALAQGARLFVADPDPDRIAPWRGRDRVECVPPEALLTMEADVVSPCARGGVIGRSEAEHLRCRVVAGSANNVLSEPAAGRTLHQRGIAYAPDFVVNAGALIQGSTWFLERRRVDAEVPDRIRATLKAVFARAQKDGCPPEEVAVAMAREKLVRPKGWNALTGACAGRRDERGA